MVEDVAWHPRHADLFGSVGDDKKLVIWDLRKPHAAAQDKEVEAHTGGWVRVRGRGSALAPLPTCSSAAHEGLLL